MPPKRQHRDIVSDEDEDMGAGSGKSDFEGSDGFPETQQGDDVHEAGAGDKGGDDLRMGVRGVGMMLPSASRRRG